jgi:hypothetical protein
VFNTKSVHIYIYINNICIFIIHVYNSVIFLLLIFFFTRHIFWNKNFMILIFWSIINNTFFLTFFNFWNKNSFLICFCNCVIDYWQFAITMSCLPQCGKRPLTKGKWKFWMANKIHFILAGLASNSCKASRNLKTLATITGYSFKIS